MQNQKIEVIKWTIKKYLKILKKKIISDFEIDEQKYFGNSFLKNGIISKMSDEFLQEKYLEILKKFRLIDDAFFSACFDDNAKDVEYILRIILDKDDLKVLEVQTQKSVENIYGRSVRFDVFATDTKGKLYNIEVQRADYGAIPQRARYNSVMIDYHELKKQGDFKELPESFVIFISMACKLFLQTRTKRLNKF